MKLSPREFMTCAAKSVRSSVGVHKYWWEYFLSETSRLYDDARVERSRPATHWHRAGAGHGAWATRANDVLPQPAEPRYRLVHIGFESPGGRDLNRDKDKHGHRYDSVGICNGVIHAGASCVRLSYDPTDPERMARELSAFDGYIVRINPGQLSHPGVPDGAQDAFDALMMDFVAHGKPVWSSPAVQTTMGAKDALVRINQMSCGLPDTLSYYTPAQFSEGFRKTAAFQPRVVKQNRGSAGEGVWLCWLPRQTLLCQLRRCDPRP